MDKKLLKTGDIVYSADVRKIVTGRIVDVDGYGLCIDWNPEGRPAVNMNFHLAFGTLQEAENERKELLKILREQSARRNEIKQKREAKRIWWDKNRDHIQGNCDHDIKPVFDEMGSMYCRCSKCGYEESSDEFYREGMNGDV